MSRSPEEPKLHLQPEQAVESQQFTFLIFFGDKTMKAGTDLTQQRAKGAGFWKSHMQ